ncbi:MAG: alpha/beta hydrolase [Verrucomicrobiales bacterium]
MRKTTIRFGRLLAATAAIGLSTGCATKFKVQENWNARLDKPIPLEETVATWEGMRSGRVPAAEALEGYNRAVCNSVVQLASNWESDKDALSSVLTTDGTVEIEVDSVNVRNVGSIDQVVPAQFVKVRRGFDSTTEVEGVGCPLLVRQPHTPEDPMIPESGLWYPVTAVLNLDNRQRPILELFDPTREGEIPFGGRRLPLAVNYTATFARDFEDRQRQFLALPALFRFDQYAERMGLSRLSAFDPEKEVCVLVHGIYSSPATWDETLNRLYENKEIRERYEFWSFGYPTGAPVPFVASKFRTALQEMHGFRRENGASSAGATLVGHSMGGLISKAVTLGGGDKEWNMLYNVPVDELNVEEADREVLREMIYYDPLPFVKRVVFCATPHRGSKLADNPLMRLAGNLIHLPTQLVRVSTDIIEGSRYALTPLGFEMAEERPTSIDQLRTSSRATAEFLNRPLNPEVAYHSIIGVNARKGKKLEKTHDTVVYYTSARLEGVESERIVYESNHGVHKEEEGVEEIGRILSLP